MVLWHLNAFDGGEQAVKALTTGFQWLVSGGYYLVGQPCLWLRQAPTTDSLDRPAWHSTTTFVYRVANVPPTENRRRCSRSTCLCGVISMGTRDGPMTEKGERLEGTVTTDLGGCAVEFFAGTRAFPSRIRVVRRRLRR